MRGTRTTIAAGMALSLTGCLSTEGGTPGDDCTSHFEPVASAPDRTALKRTLLDDVDPRTRALRLIDEDPGDDKVVVNLLDRKRRLVMSLDMWQRADGTWTAQRWSQCID